MKTFLTVLRFVVGLVFIFSGFVKGIDPLGTAFKLEDYLMYYHLDWFLPLSLALSILLSALEFSLGVLLILKVRPVLVTWLLLLMMSFFTLLTFYDAIYEPVKDCGCFGDALILSNWQTFYKNIVLIIFVIILFINRKKLKSAYNPFGEWALMLGVPLIFAWFSVVNYRNLPMIDFLAWKEGNDMVPERNLPLQFTLTYKNKSTGVEKQYVSPNFPYDDPEWLEQWEFVSQCVVDPNPPPPHNLQILDQEFSDVTANFLENPDYQFILAIWNSGSVNKLALKKMNSFYHKAEHDGHSFIAITPTIEEGEELAKELGLDYEFYFADDIELKIMVRSNPGLVLLKDGVVQKKWSYRNIPDYNDVKKIIPELSEHN